MAHVNKWPCAFFRTSTRSFTGFKNNYFRVLLFETRVLMHIHIYLFPVRFTKLYSIFSTTRPMWLYLPLEVMHTLKIGAFLKMRTFIFIVPKYVSRVTSHEHGPCWKHTNREHGRYTGSQFYLPWSRTVNTVRLNRSQSVHVYSYGMLRDPTPQIRPPLLVAVSGCASRSAYSLRLPCWRVDLSRAVRRCHDAVAAELKLSPVSWAWLAVYVGKTATSDSAGTVKSDLMRQFCRKIQHNLFQGRDRTSAASSDVKSFALTWSDMALSTSAIINHL